MTAGLGLRNPAFLGALGGAIPLFDDFDRPDSTDLGVTSVGGAEWQELVGAWEIFNNRIRSTSGTNPLAVVDAGTADVDISLDVSSTGRDAIIFRCSDANNWLRLSNYYTSSYSCASTWRHQVCFNQSGTDQTTVSGCGFCPSCPSGYPVDGGCSFGSGCNCSTTHTRRVYLHKMENGTLTTPHASSYSVSTTSKLRVVANGDQVSIYSGTGTNLVATVTQTFNQAAELHGVGRSQLGNTGTAMDNFDLTPV